ncbi:hypothetical protein Thiosp_02910 [Thiorhodovibrio litoralis]|uniref:hypothetical protein n=1 Tax=Thiorhodovibrio winogradskyi TaxID=77007 RepID=UPI0031FC68D6|nr:hypothetical protein Thiosp_02910 [Thiorhodovibrio litoralis]
MRKRGVDKINVYGRDIPVKRYTIDTDEVAIDLWYHDELGWVQLVSETGKGATLIYRRI